MESSAFDIHTRYLPVTEIFQSAVHYQAQGHPDIAIGCYRKALEIAPEFVEAHYNLGTLYYQQRNWTAAVHCFQRAVALKPRWTPALSNCAAALRQNGQDDQAISVYQRLLNIEPRNRQAVINLGSLLIKTNRYPQAIDLLDQAVVHWPDDHLILNNLGLAYHLSGSLDLAVSTFKSAIAAAPKYARTYHNLGNVYLDLRDMDATVAAYRAALDLTPQDFEAHDNMGRLYLGKLDLANARRHFHASVTLNPNAAEVWVSLAKCELMQGDFKAGWKHLHWRFKAENCRIHTYPFQYSAPKWDGANFRSRRLLVHCEQGLGDTIQFSRFLPLVKERGGRVTFQVQKQLFPLYENYPGIDTLEQLPERQPESIAEDLSISLMDLPGCLNVSLDTIPSATPYLFADPRKVLQWRRNMPADRIKVGLVWSGNAMFKNNKLRSCPLERMLCLKQISKIQCYSLQHKPTDVERRLLSNEEGVIHLGDDFSDFGDTAAAMANLDLMITVDTSVAHLAGAMGKPTWLLLPHLPDWRWMLDRPDSPWYPTMRLFRQPSPGNWDAVVEAVNRALREYSQSAAITRISY